MYKKGDINPEILRRWIHMPGVSAIDFDADSTRVAASSFSTIVCLFNFNPRERTLHLAAHEIALVDVCFNTDATFIATCGASTVVQVFEDPSSRESAYSTYDCHFDIVNSVDFSKDTDYILTASADSNVRIIDLRIKVPVVKNMCHLSAANCARYFNSNDSFVSCGDDRFVNIWDPRMPIRAKFFMMEERVSKIMINSFDRMIAAVTANGITICDIRVNRRLQEYFPEQNQSFVSADFHAKKPWALMGQSNGTIIVADLFSGRPVFEMSNLMDQLTDSKFSKCGNYFAVCGKDKQSQVSLYAVKREQKPVYICDAPMSLMPSSSKGKTALTKEVKEIKANKMSNQPNWRPRKWSKTKHVSQSLEMLPRVANKRAEDLNTMSQMKELNVRTPRKKLNIEHISSPGLLMRARSLMFSTSDADTDVYCSESDTDTTPFLDSKRFDVDQPIDSNAEKSGIFSKNEDQEGDGSTPVMDVAAEALIPVKIQTEIEKAGSSESASNISSALDREVANAEEEKKNAQENEDKQKLEEERNKDIALKNITAELQVMCTKYVSFLKASHVGEEHLSNQLQRIILLLEDKKMCQDNPDILLKLKERLTKVGTFLRVYSSGMETYALAIGDDIDELK